MSIKNAIKNLNSAFFWLSDEVADSVIDKLVKMSSMKRHVNKEIKLICGGGVWILFIDDIGYPDENKLPLKVISDIIKPIIRDYGWSCIPTGTIKCLNGNIIHRDFY